MCGRSSVSSPGRQPGAFVRLQAHAVCQCDGGWPRPGPPPRRTLSAASFTAAQRAPTFRAARGGRITGLGGTQAAQGLSPGFRDTGRSRRSPRDSRAHSRQCRRSACRRVAADVPRARHAAGLRAGRCARFPLPHCRAGERSRPAHASAKRAWSPGSGAAGPARRRRRGMRAGPCSRSCSRQKSA